MFGRVVGVFIDAQHDGDVFVLGRGADDHFLDGAAQVGGGFFLVGEASGGFDDYLRADLFPGNLGRVFLGEDAEVVAGHLDGVFGEGDLLFQVAEDRIVFEQVRESLGVGQIINRDEVNLLVAQSRPQDVAPDTAKTINANF